MLNNKEKEQFWKKTSNVSYSAKRYKNMACFKASKHLPALLLVGKAAGGCQKSTRPQEYCHTFTVCYV
jgi:hypothetical protein